MPLALVIADAEWVVNDILASLPWGDWEVDVLDDPVQSGARVADTAPDVVIVDLQVRNMGGWPLSGRSRRRWKAETFPAS